jgi:hypothetical protein
MMLPHQIVKDVKNALSKMPAGKSMEEELKYNLNVEMFHYFILFICCSGMSLRIATRPI